MLEPDCREEEILKDLFLNR